MKRLLVGAVTLGLLVISPPAVAQTPATPAFERLKQSPETGALWRAFDAAFPGEGARLVEPYIDAKGNLRDDPALGHGVLRLMLDNLNQMSRAPAPELVAFARSNAEYLRKLEAEDPALCARQAYEGMDASEAASPQAATAFLALATTTFEGIAAGRASPVKHGPVTPEDLAALESAMVAAGASSGVLALPADASVPARCTQGIQMMDAFSRMPPAAAGRFLAAVVGRMGGDPTAGLEVENVEFDGPLADYVAAVADESEGFRLLHQEFPKPAEAAVAAMRDELSRTRDVQKSADLLAQHMLAMVKAGAPDIARADDKALKDVTAALAGYYAALEDDDPEVCGAVAMGTGTPRQPMSPQVRRASEANLNSMVRALVAGRRTPVQRGAPTAKDVSRVRAAMLRGGLSRELTVAMLSGGLDKHPPAAQCAATVAMMKAVGEMPDDAAARVTALMVQIILTVQPTS